MLIAQISDTHIALDTPDSEHRIRDFEDIIAHINSLDPAPDLIIHTGDIVQNGRSDEYQTAARILEQASAPVYLMVGNKDDRANLRAAFPRADYLNRGSDFISYSITGFPVQLVILDTLNPGSRKGEICEKRLEEFAELCGTDNNKPIAVFAHHPPFLVDEGPEPLHFESEENMQRFRDALTAVPSITNLFCGHVHRGVAGTVEDIPALVMTATATSLRRGEYPQDLQLCPIYHVHQYELEWGFTSRIEIVRT